MRRTDTISVSLTQVLEEHLGVRVRLSFPSDDKSKVIVALGESLPDLGENDMREFFRRRKGERAVDAAWERNL